LRRVPEYKREGLKALTGLAKALTGLADARACKFAPRTFVLELQVPPLDGVVVNRHPGVRVGLLVGPFPLSHVLLLERVGVLVRARLVPLVVEQLRQLTGDRAVRVLYSNSAVLGVSGQPRKVSSDLLDDILAAPVTICHNPRRLLSVAADVDFAVDRDPSHAFDRALEGVAVVTDAPQRAIERELAVELLNQVREVVRDLELATSLLLVLAVPNARTYNVPRLVNVEAAPAPASASGDDDEEDDDNKEEEEEEEEAGDVEVGPTEDPRPWATFLNLKRHFCEPEMT